MKVQVNRGFISLAGSALIRFLGLTWRVEWRGLENVRKARGMSPQVIYSFWHGRLLALSYTHRKRRIQVLASEHSDGDLMGRTIEHLGFGHLKGSTSRGGARALRELSAVLRDGLDVGLTVDGPRGPRGLVQQGAIELSRLTGSAVVPVSDSARPRRLFSSWDRFQFPYPFAKIVVSFGEPFVVPRRAGSGEREQFRLRLQENLRVLTARLDVSLDYGGMDVWPHEDS